MEKNLRYEVKAFVSGPVTFSPTLNFDSIFFLDSSDLLNGYFILYHVKCSSKKMQDFKVDKIKTFKDFELSGKRARCQFDFLLRQFRKKNLPIDFYKISVNMDNETIKIGKLFFPM